MKPDNPARGWTPDYRTSSGIPITVPGIRSEDCPKSAALLFPEAAELVQLYYRGKVVGFPPPSKLPIPIADAFLIIQQEESKIENAEHEAERRVHQ